MDQVEAVHPNLDLLEVLESQDPLERDCSDTHHHLEDNQHDPQGTSQ